MNTRAINHIAVFDSGVGGLTVLKSLIHSFPSTNFTYLGDTARLPYGAKTADTILKYTLQNVKYLESAHPFDLLVLACNSASTIIKKIPQKNYPIHGVIKSGVDSAIQSNHQSKRYVLWGTRATVEANSYANNFNAIKPDIKVTSVPCPLLVPLVEENLLDGPITEVILDHYINQSDFRDGDTLILGCTHYPALKKILKKKLPQINIVDSAQALTSKIQNLYAINKKEQNQKLNFLFTDLSSHQKNTAKNLLGFMPENIKLVDTI